MTNLQINFNKSEALNISLNNDEISRCQSNLPFKWNGVSITYLGIQLPTHLTNLYSKNYLTILQHIQKDLKSWSTGIFSWFGRASIIKMNILPRLLYLFQTIPIKLPQAIFASVRSICSTFIWGKAKPRISFDRLTIPKLRGGIGLPDISKYYWACQLTRIIDWNVHSSTKDWVNIEHSFSLIPLRQLPWTIHTHVPQNCKQHPLIATILYKYCI